LSIDLEILRKIKLWEKSYGTFFEIFLGTQNLRGGTLNPRKSRGNR